MSKRSREITACFLEEAEAQRAMDELTVLLQVAGPVAPETADEPHWTLNILLPDIPAPATGQSEEPLLAMVEGVLDRLGGSVRDEVELSPSVLAELRRRLETPMTEWVLMTATDQERRSRDGDQDITPE